MRNLLGLMTRRGRAIGVYFKDSPDPPPAPNYAAAAQAQGVANIDAARLQNRANKVDEYTPYGSRVYNMIDGDRWSSSINLTPIGREIFNSQNNISRGMGQAGENAVGRAIAAFNQPLQGFDRNAYADALMQRSDRNFARDEEAMRARLMNAGMGPGTEAYQREFERLDQSRNDARNLAYLNAGNEMGSDMERQAYIRSLPLNELNALRTGAQVNMPQFNATPGAANVQAAPVMSGMQNQYNAQMDAYNAQAAQNAGITSGLFGLGSAALASPWLFASDRRLKTDIEPFGELNGFNLYRYRYVWGGPEVVGVMADEVKKVLPHAVVNIGGFDHVDYAEVLNARV